MNCILVSISWVFASAPRTTPCQHPRLVLISASSLNCSYFSCNFYSYLMVLNCFTRLVIVISVACNSAPLWCLITIRILLLLFLSLQLISLYFFPFLSHSVYIYLSLSFFSALTTPLAISLYMLLLLFFITVFGDGAAFLIVVECMLHEVLFLSSILSLSPHLLANHLVCYCNWFALLAGVYCASHPTRNAKNLFWQSRRNPNSPHYHHHTITTLYIRRFTLLVPRKASLKSEWMNIKWTIRQYLHSLALCHYGCLPSSRLALPLSSPSIYS